MQQIIPDRIRCFLLLLFWTSGLAAVPLQHEVPYFVDTVGAEFDPGLEARNNGRVAQLPESQRPNAMMRNHLLGMNPWRINLKNDGTWEPDLYSGRKDYADRHYPVKYVLPEGYRGGILMVWSVPGAPPVQIVDDKIEVYFPATGVYETSTPPPREQGSVASIEHAFYFERDGKRTNLYVEPFRSGRVGIIGDMTDCPKDQPGRLDRVNCFAYFVGTNQDLSALSSAKCPNNKEMTRVIESGHSCFEISPGSTQPVSDLVPPKGTPAAMANKFHGRTGNGRPVELSVDKDGTRRWQYDGPEPVIPRESTLVVELKSYIEMLLKAPKNGSPGDLPESTSDLLKLAASGPCRFVWSPFSGKIAAEFFSPTEQHSRPGNPFVPGLMFVKRKQGWTLDGIILGRTDMSKSKSAISKIMGRAMMKESTAVILREDGTWELEDKDAPQPELQRETSGYDLNGNRYALETGENDYRTWRRMDTRPLPESLDSVVSQLHKMWERNVELLSEGNIEEFLANGGAPVKSPYHYYQALEKFGDNSEEAHAMYELFKESPDLKARVEQSEKGDEIQVLRQFFLEAAVRQVDVPAQLQRMKFLSSAPHLAGSFFSRPGGYLYAAGQIYNRADGAWFQLDGNN